MLRSTCGTPLTPLPGDSLSSSWKSDSWEKVPVDERWGVCGGAGVEASSSGDNEPDRCPGMLGER